MAELDAK